jgi:hypothetical protein
MGGSLIYHTRDGGSETRSGMTKCVQDTKTRMAECSSRRDAPGAVSARVAEGWVPTGGGAGHREPTRDVRPGPGPAQASSVKGIPAAVWGIPGPTAGGASTMRM